ncbi:MAG TPA: hypothetical protein PKJ95_06145 [Atribacterota bacterium]|nr:hypothetical protein [Atribacterota bacterium]
MGRILCKSYILPVRKIITYSFVALLFFLLGIKSSISFTQSDETNLRKGEDSYFQAQELFLESAAQHDVSLQILEESISLFTETEEQPTKYYWLAEVLYLMGVIEKDRNSHEKAKIYFSSSKESISTALKLKDFSEGYRLLADVEGQLIIYGDLLYKTKFGPPIKNMINKAIKLDPGNEKAYFSLAMYYRDAPFIAGGDLKKSEAVLKDMIDINKNTQIDLFSLYLWIETAWVNSEFNPEKISDCISILDLFSNKEDIDSMIARIERKYMNNK